MGVQGIVLKPDGVYYYSTATARHFTNGEPFAVTRCMSIIQYAAARKPGALKQYSKR